MPTPYGMPVQKTFQEKIQDELAKVKSPEDRVRFSLFLKDPITKEDAVYLGQEIEKLENKTLGICNDVLTNQALEIVSPSFAKMKNLTSLDLSSNDFNSSTLSSTLYPVLPETKVSSLDLSDNHLYSSALVSLARVMAKTEIRSLNLGRNSIDDEGFTALGDIMEKTKLEELTIHRNKIKEKGVVAFASHLPKSRLRLLQLNFNEAGPKGAAAIADTLPQSSLEVLYLSQNGIGDEGMKALAKAIPNSKLKDIDLYDNGITEEGAKHLLIALQNENCKIVKLNIGDNKFSPEMADLLKKAVENNVKRMADREKAKEEKSQTSSPEEIANTARTASPEEIAKGKILLEAAYAGCLPEVISTLTAKGQTPPTEAFLTPDENGCTPLSLACEQKKLAQLITPDNFKNAQEVQKIWDAVPVADKEQMDGKEGRPNFQSVKSVIMKNAVLHSMQIKKAQQMKR